MKVVLAEKPSVARELASFLGAGARREGYYEGRGYQVTWALGHLVTLKEPEDYDPGLKKWSLATLPFVPRRFELKPVKDKRAAEQFALIRRLFRAADEIICATDAGREGELIFRYILEMTGSRGKPLRRLWLSSLTARAIGEAFKNLRPGSEFDNLYAAARCRSEADWIVGLNATRNLTVRYGADGILWSVGRVQTPVLALIVRRDDEIRNFRPEPFWELFTQYRKTDFRYAGDRFTKEEEARQLLERVTGHEFEIRNVQTSRESSLPPQLYDLTELQRDLNRRYGMSAADTLQAAQSLYESKLITYPRTDSRYLGTDMKPEVPGILRRLHALRPREIEKLKLDQLALTGRIINDKKVGDHHAIIPTGALPPRLPPRQEKVYDAVVTRLIAAFYPPCVKELTRVDGQSNGVAFRARGVRVIAAGWTELYPRKKADNKDELPELPSFTRGESGPHAPFVKQGETTPPKHFTENTLLGAMETAGKLVDDESLKEALKEKGLGTPATRAAIIETLLKRHYITRSKKNLAATDLGRYLVALVQDRNLKSAELTGEWEAKLKRIESGRLDPRQFMNEIRAFTTQVIQGSDVSAIDESRLGDCPRCGRAVIKGRRGFGCSGWRDGCPFVLWSTYKDQQLSAAQIGGLLQHRILPEPVTLPAEGKVILCLADSGHVMEIPVPSSQAQSAPRHGGRRPPRSKAEAKSTTRRKPRRGASTGELGACPLCGAAVVEQPRSFGCSGWKQGCKFVIWKSIAGKRITKRTAQTLLRQGETSVLKGFKSKAGKPFDARLKLDHGDVRFDFDS